MDIYEALLEKTLTYPSGLVIGDGAYCRTIIDLVAARGLVLSKKDVSFCQKTAVWHKMRRRAKCGFAEVV